MLLTGQIGKSTFKKIKGLKSQGNHLLSENKLIQVHKKTGEIKIEGKASEIIEQLNFSLEEIFKIKTEGIKDENFKNKEHRQNQKGDPKNKNKTHNE